MENNEREAGMWVWGMVVEIKSLRLDMRSQNENFTPMKLPLSRQLDICWEFPGRGTGDFNLRVTIRERMEKRWSPSTEVNVDGEEA